MLKPAMRVLSFTRIIFLFLILHGLAFAKTPLELKLATIDVYAEKAHKDWEIPGMAVAIVKDDKVVFAKGYGIRKLGGKEAVDKNTLFAVASNSKAFTTAALAILIDEGKIGSWDDRVSEYLPDFQLYDPYVTKNLTIRSRLSLYEAGKPFFDESWQKK